MAALPPPATRATIYTLDDSAANKLKSFDYTMLTETEQGWVDNACSPVSRLSQCIFLATPELATVNDGTNIVNFVRGQTSGEGTLYRDRKHALGRYGQRDAILCALAAL